MSRSLKWPLAPLMLINKIVSYFNESGISFSQETKLHLKLNSPIGDLDIEDDGEEILIYISDITHCHFEYDNSNLELNFTDIIEFLNNLFHNKILLHKSRDGKRGGWEYLENESDFKMNNDLNFYYFWSGKI